MTKIRGNTILDEVVDRLNIDLPALVAGCAFWSPVSDDAIKAAYPHVRRARSGEKRGTVTSEGSRLDDNTFANRVPKAALSHLGKFEGFAVCHIWPQTCYDPRYHTMPANLVLVPRELAGLTDHHRAVEQCLQYRAWELYKWFPEGQIQPQKPDKYPTNWREPISPPPAAVLPSLVRAVRVAPVDRANEVLPIELFPSDSGALRDAFIERGAATMSIHYENGRIENEVWTRLRLGPAANVIGNLRSKAKFRYGVWQRLEIAKVIVEVHGHGMVT